MERLIKGRYYIKQFLIAFLYLAILFCINFATAKEYTCNKTFYKDCKYKNHFHNEKSFQHAHCSSIYGIEEYELKDKTRVDCITDEYAIEYDFINKKYEGIGQALYYGFMTGKKPKLVLILDKNQIDRQIPYCDRINKMARVYNFEVEYITEDILNVDSEGKCPYIDCKCHKKR